MATSAENVAQRNVIEYCVQLKMTPTQTFKHRTTEINSQIVNHVRDVIDTDRRSTVREISQDIGISKTSVHRILHEALGMSRVCARWFPLFLIRR